MDKQTLTEILQHMQPCGTGEKESAIDCMPSPDWSDKNICETTTKDSYHILCRRGHGYDKENDQHCGKFSEKENSN